MYNLLLEVVSENAGLVENSIDADETPHSVVLSGSTLFDQARLSEYIRNTLKIAGLVENSVYAFPVPEDKSGQQVVDSLQRQVEQLGAVKTGNFCVDCETYQSNAQIAGSQRLVHVLHNSEQPASCFSVLDTGTTLVADLLFEVLIVKLTQSKSGKDSFYQQRKGFKIETKGPRYELGDFIIKIGSVSLASNFKGILVEVEYCPCLIPAECWNLMKELMQSFMGSVVENPPAQMKNKFDDIYTASDTINQYLEHFNTFRKTTATQPVR